MSEPATAPPAGPAEAPVPDSPFAALALRRRELGMSLEDVAQQLKFAPRQIESLESGDFLRLPTGTFARGMLRSYARVLKLDAAPMLAALDRRHGATAQPAEAVVLRDPVPFADGTRRVNLAYAVVSLGILVAVGVLAVAWMHDGGDAAKLAFVPAARTPPAPQTMVSSTAATPVIVAAEPEVRAEPAPVQTPNAPAKAEPDPGPEAAPAGGRRRISLQFERESWVEITDRAGRRLISQLNPAGSEQAVEGVPPFAVVVGNAQHVKLTYDNRAVDLMPYVKIEVARLTLD